MKRYLSLFLIFILLLSGCMTKPSGSSSSSDIPTSSDTSDTTDVPDEPVSSDSDDVPVSTDAPANDDPTFDPADFDESGTCGDNAYWGYNIDDGELVIWGSGEMYNYERVPYPEDRHNGHEYSSAPWGRWKVDSDWDIRNLKIYGISYIGEWAFVEDCYYLETVLISNSVTNIGVGALDGWWYIKTRCEKVEFTGTVEELEALEKDSNDIFWEHPVVCSDGYYYD